MELNDTTFDTRHDLPTAIKKPKQGGDLSEVFGYYCHTTPKQHGCGRLWSEFVWERYGKCPHCGGNAMAGCSKYPLSYRISFFFWSCLQNWRAIGHAGWGWRVSFWRWCWNKFTFLGE